MEAVRNHPDPAPTGAGRSWHATDATTAAPVDTSEVEAFDHLHRHDPSRRATSAVDTMARWRGDEVRWVDLEEPQPTIAADDPLAVVMSVGAD